MKKIGEYDFVKRYIGSNEVKKIYIGSNLTWESNSSLLPSDFLELEYLQSSGEPYINTGIRNDSSVIIDIKISATGGDRLSGVESGSWARYKWGTNGDGYIYYGFGGNHASSVRASLNNTYTFHLLQSQQYVKDSNGNTILSSSESISSYPTLSIMLFKYVSGGSLSGAGNGTTRIYYCNIQTSTTNLLFIPAKRKSDNVLGLYDLVSGTFFTNAGSGSFVAGPDVNN